MAELLYTSKYVKPGAYIGQVITPSSSVATALRIPTAIGKGSKYALSKNASVVRAYVYDEDVVFSATSPYRAILKHNALMDIEKAALVRVSDNYEIPESKWYFEDVNHIIISEEEYVAGDFQLSYQSTDDSVFDPAPVNDIMGFRHAGDSADASKYVEGTDYFLITSFSDITKSNGDAQNKLHFDDRYASDSLYATIDGVVSTATGNGTVSVDVSDVKSVSFNSNVVATPKQVKLVSKSASIAYVLSSVATPASKDLTLENIGITYDKNKVIDVSISLDGYTEATSKANVDGTTATGHGFWYYDVTTGVLTVWQTSEIKNLPITYEYKSLSSVVFSYTYVLDAYGSLGEATVEIPNDGTFVSVLYGVSACLSSSDSNALDYNSYDASIVTLDGSFLSEGTESTLTFNIIQGKIFPTAKDNRSVTLKLSAKNDIVYTHSIGSLSGNFSSSISATAPANNSNPIIDYVDTYTISSLSLINGTTCYLPIKISHSYPEGTSVSFIYYVRVSVSGDSITLLEDTDVSLDNGIKVSLKKSLASVDVVYTQNSTLVTFKHSCVSSAPSSGAIEWYYTSNTSEGGFGTIKCDSISGTIELPGNIIIYYNANDLSVGDSFIFTLTNENKISWNLTKKVTESFKTSLVYRDVNGAVTGIYGSYYVSLSGVPLNGIAITNLGTLKAKIVTDSAGNATSFVRFVNSNDIPAKPSSTIQISYEYEGIQPSAGSTYYLTTIHIRPSSLYNSVQIISSRKEGELLFAPATPTNDLYIANEIAWDEIGDTDGAQIAFIQIKDSDDDGVITDTDVHNAIDAVATSKKVTDITLLGQFGNIGYLCRMNQDANDPFAARENELWVGAPTGTVVGDVNTEGSLVYIAKSTLKVYGDDPAHGTRILVGSTWAKKSITMDSGKAQSVTMDGSFIAWALACCRSVMGTSDSILRKHLYSFSDMEIWDDVNNDLLGAANIVYLSKSSDSIYQIEEDFTVDTYNFTFSLEQISSQRLVTVRRVRQFLNENGIGYVPDTPQAGIAFVSSLLIRALKQLVNDGTIGPYQDEDGYAREIDPDKDVFITYVKDDSTKYQFGYGFYTKKVIKQLFGIYVVDKDFSSLGIGQ